MTTLRKLLILLALCCTAPAMADDKTPITVRFPRDAWITTDLALALPDRTFAQTRAAFAKAPIRFEMPKPDSEPPYAYYRVTRRKMLVEEAFNIGGTIADFMLRRDNAQPSQSYLVANTLEADAQQCEAKFARFIDGLGTGLALDRAGWDIRLRAGNGGMDPFELRRNFGTREVMVAPIGQLDAEWGLKRALISTPQGARYGAMASDNAATLTPWLTEWHQPGAPFAVRALGHFGSAYEGLYGNCHIAAALMVQQDTADAPALAAAPVDAPLIDRTALAPILLSYHYQALEQLELSPRLQRARQAGETMRLSCRIHPDDGRLTACNPVEALRLQDVAAARALSALGNAYRLQDWTFDEDRFAYQPILIDFALSAADSLPVIDWDNAQLVTNGMVLPRPGWPSAWFPLTEADYPAAALVKGLEADFEFDCLFLADQSVFCDRFTITPAENAEAFATAIARIKRRSLNSRAAPLLSDGSPAAGRKFHLKVKFRLPE